MAEFTPDRSLAMFGSRRQVCAGDRRKTCAPCHRFDLRGRTFFPTIPVLGFHLTMPFLLVDRNDGGTGRRDGARLRTFVR